MIITIGRQIGSGGREIAQKLAEKFGCTLYDKELLSIAARESGFSEHFFEENDEKKRLFPLAVAQCWPHVFDGKHLSKRIFR